MVYRIRIWLQRTAKNLTVYYDLHPEEQNKPITRVGVGETYDQWLNTSNDYTIRVRTSDGFEWSVGTVLQALSRRYALSPHEEVMAKADVQAQKEMNTRVNGEPFAETVDQALRRLLEQSARYLDSPGEWLSS